MSIQFSVSTEKSFEVAISDLKAALASIQFGVLWELSFKDKLKEKGLDFDGKAHILEACNPGKAKEVLEQNIEASYFLPCKVVVYEKQGIVHMGMLKPTDLMDLFQDPSLMAVAQAVEADLKQALEIAKS